MKKLLSILGSLTLMASSTVAVVACNDEKEPEVTTPDFDFASLYNKFMGEVRTILTAQLEKAFAAQAWIGEDKLPSSIGKITDIIKNKAEYANTNSQAFADLSKWVLGIVPIQEINTQLTRSVINNINYRAIIFDKQSPVKDGFLLEKVKVTEKGDNVTLDLTLATNVIYKGQNGEKGQDKMTFEVAINVFKVLTDAELAQNTQDAYANLFNITNANKYTYESNSGDLEKNLDAINKDTNLKKSFIADIDTIKKQINDFDTNNRINLKTDDLIYRGSEENTLDASRGKSYTTVKPFSGDESDKALQKALYVNDENEVWNESEFTDHMKGNSTSWLLNSYPDDELAKELQAAMQTEKTTISEAINRFHLQANYENNSNLKNVFDNQGSRFAVDLNNDKTIIALYGVKIKGAKFTMDGVAYDFSPITVAIRQKLPSSYMGTKALYDQFIDHAFRFQKAIFNIEKDETGTNRATNILMPAKYASATTAEKYDAEAFFEECLNENQKAINQASELGLKSQIYSASGKYKIDTIVINSNKQGFFYNSEGADVAVDRSNLPEFRTYFFSSGLSDSNKVGFTFGPYGTFNKDTNRPDITLDGPTIRQHDEWASDIYFKVNK